MTARPAIAGALVGSDWVATGPVSEVLSPYSGRPVEKVATSDRELANPAVLNAQTSLDSPLPAWRRAEILEAAAETLVADRERFAATIVAEAGKPIKQARIEATRAAETLRLSAIEARRLAGEIVPLDGTAGGEGQLAYTMRVALGVVAAITPFNFPLNLVAHKLGPALAAGNAVVLKPAIQTPLSAIALTKALLDAGLPEGRLQLLVGSGAEVGDVLVAHPDIAAVSFTGSRETGWRIAERAARKRVFLELGSTSPVIVCRDSDWPTAAEKIAQHGFSYAGQSCISVQRVLVEEPVARDFVGLLGKGVESLVVGDPAAEETDVGPLIDGAARHRVCQWVAEARTHSADLVAGGEVSTDGVLMPTVLNHPAAETKVWREEVFGPVVSVRTFAEFDDAIRSANDSDYGLQAGVFTSDLSKALRATRELEFGGVLINEVPTVRADLQPYGGVKDSGRGREGPAWAVREFSEERFVSWQAG